MRPVLFVTMSNTHPLKEQIALLIGTALETVAPDAPVATGTAEVVTDPEGYRPVVKALKKKYGLQVTLIELGGRVKQLVKRNPNPDCALVITLD